MGDDESSHGRYATRSTDGEVEVYDTENEEAWIRSDVTEKLSWMV